MTLERKRPPNPYDHLPETGSLDVWSTDISDGEQLHLRHAHGSAAGENVSPNLQWSAGPEGTASYAVTCFDPDAPTPSGWWHWIVVDLPRSVTELATGAGTDGSLPGDAMQMREDFGGHGYGGSAPPPGDHPHRYIFTVHAIDVPSLGLDAETTPSMATANLTFHALARGHLTALYSH